MLGGGGVSWKQSAVLGEADRIALAENWRRGLHVSAEASEHTLDGLLAACLARFGADQTPSRSALHRFLGRH